MDNKDQAKGKLKQAVGDLTDDKDLKHEGNLDKKAGDAKAFVDKVGNQVGDKINGLVDSAKKVLTRDGE
jgi:uncharacterized protein YjbJ (UPF0337 family)